MPPFANDAGHATPNLFGSVLALELTDHPSQADEDSICSAVMHSMNLDAEKRQPLMDAGQIFHIAGEPIERFDNHNAEFAIARCVHEAHQAVAAKDRSAGAGDLRNRRIRSRSEAIGGRHRSGGGEHTSRRDQVGYR